MKVKHMRRGVIALAAVALAIPVFTASATVIVPAGPRVGSLVQVGPVAAENGFPTWYRDNNGAGVTSRLEMCLPVPPATADPFCAPPVLPNPNAPMVYPTNYPNEIFYQLATAAPSANTLVEMNLEGAYATGAVIPGDEIVFGRIRIRDRTIADGVTWRVTHPYGIDEITATGGKGINMTQDVGLTPGAFGTALGSRIGPFLKWDPAVPPAAPAGYTGDPAVPHAVVGSPYGTNSVKVEQKNPDGTFTLISQTALFSVQGRYATNSGVDVDRAVYAQQADGTGTVDVFASSEVGQSIQVKANAAVGFSTSLLRGEQGRYFGRLPVTAAGGVPSGATIDVINAGDKPVALKTVKLADIVTITSAVYTVGAAGSSQLVVTASSSDALNNPALAVTGFGPLVGGTGTFTTDAPPPMITVTSARGGSATITVSVTGPPFSAIAPVAAFTAPATATSGQTVTLNGTGSTGDITTWTWTQTAGPAVVLTGAGTSIVTFSPVDPGTYTFELVVAGPGGTSAPASNSVVVSAAVPLVANAGVDQAVQRGTLATLDASATSGQKSLAWTQTLGQTMTLSSTTATKPTFTYPLMALPSAPVGSANPGYVRDNAPLTFQMTALGVDGVTTASDTVVISPLAETISGVTARYRTGGGGWRVTGTTSILAGQRVTVVLGPLPTGRTIGTATVDNVGAFSVRAGLSPDPRVPAPTATQVTVISQTGAMASFNLTITT